mgnify:CR=1 FL=1
MEINNLMSYCIDNKDACSNPLFYIGDIIGNSILVISINDETKKIYKYSNEWLYLINTYYPNNPHYNAIVDTYNNIINNIIPININYINENVLSFVTSFSIGTVHGYSGLYCILLEYINNISKYKDLKIIVAKNSQTGILNIIEHFCNRNVINKNNVIYLDSHVSYKFKTITFIPNKYHIFNVPFANDISKIIDKYIIHDKLNIEYYKSLLIPNNIDNICIIKGSQSKNITEFGIIQQEIINVFCNKYNLLLIEPTNYHEIIFIHHVNRCKYLVITWGTTFMKNFIYISDECTKILVLVIGNEFIKQYNMYLNNNILITKFKNANLIYKIVSENLDINPFN